MKTDSLPRQARDRHTKQKLPRERKNGWRFHRCSSITRFTLEVFELFVCSVTFLLGFERIISKFTRPRDDTWSFGDALFSTAMSALTFILAMGLSGASERKFLNPILRRALSGRENASLFEFFLCLSRACLGKMISFSIKCGQKDAPLPSPTSIVTFTTKDQFTETGSVYQDRLGTNVPEFESEDS